MPKEATKPMQNHIWLRMLTGRRTPPPPPPPQKKMVIRILLVRLTTTRTRINLSPSLCSRWRCVPRGATAAPPVAGALTKPFIGFITFQSRFSRNSFWATVSRNNQLFGIVPDRYCDVNNNTWGNVYRWGYLFTHHLATKHSVGSCRNATFLKSQVHHTSCTNLTFLSFKVASSG